MYILFGLVAVVIVSLVVAGARRMSERKSLQQANTEIRAALSGNPAEVHRRMTELGTRLCQANPRQAMAAVQASRTVFSRYVAPVLVGLLGHPSEAVAQAAAAALNDLGSPGLRAAWEARQGDNLRARRIGAFLVAHPDWLFERLLTSFVQEGPSSVQAHRSWWSTDGMQQRLQVLADTADAVNRERVKAIREALTTSSDHVA